jgi:acyl carrier protein
MKPDVRAQETICDPALMERFWEFYGLLGLTLDEEPNAETLLVGSGLLDSLGLLQLATWIQEEIGRPIELEMFDLYEEWRTVGSVLDFIRTHRRATTREQQPK